MMCMTFGFEMLARSIPANIIWPCSIYRWRIQSWAAICFYLWRLQCKRWSYHFQRRSYVRLQFWYWSSDSAWFLLTSFVESESLQICNRFFQRDLANTYTLFHPITGMRQNYIIIGGPLLEVVDSWIDSAISSGNDDKCVYAIIRLSTLVYIYGDAKNHKSNTG